MTESKLEITPSPHIEDLDADLGAAIDAAVENFMDADSVIIITSKTGWKSPEIFAPTGQEDWVLPTSRVPDAPVKTIFVVQWESVGGARTAGLWFSTWDGRYFEDVQGRKGAYMSGRITSKSKKNLPASATEEYVRSVSKAVSPPAHVRVLIGGKTVYSGPGST